LANWRSSANQDDEEEEEKTNCMIINEISSNKPHNTNQQPIPG